MKPKVSIIIPCFNNIEFLKDTIDSVLNQSYYPLEIIVVDDGSTDGTIAYLEQIDNKDIIYKTNKGKGACAARNYGYKISNGAFIQFLDADDLLGPDKIEAQVALLQDHQEYIAVCSTSHFSDLPENGKITDRDFLYSTDKPSEFLLNLYGGNGKKFEMVQTSAWLTPKGLIEKAGLWDESLSKDQDGEFFCRVVIASKGIVYSPNVLNYYRKHPNGKNIANKNHRIHIQSQWDALNSKAFQLQPEKETNAYKNAMALQYKFLAVNAYPHFKDISKKALEKSESLGGSDYLPVLGGRIIELLKFTFGWQFAKSFSVMIHSKLDAKEK